MLKNKLRKPIGMAVFISGRGSNMQSIVESVESGLLKGIAEVRVVFCNRKDAPGLVFARKKGIPILVLESKDRDRKSFDADLISSLSKFRFDYIVLAGYMRILGKDFVQKFPRKIINIHPADTKVHQGLHGYRTAFEKGWKETKITVHYVDEGLDTGSIIAQESVDLQGLSSLEEIEKKGLAQEHVFYPKVLKQVFEASEEGL